MKKVRAENAVEICSVKSRDERAEAVQWSEREREGERSKGAERKKYRAQDYRKSDKE
jgi:hypothetical protein